MTLYFTFPGEPKAVQSFRFANIGGFARKYQPKETVEWKNWIKLQAMSQLPRGWKVCHGAAVVSAMFCFTLPKSANKGDRDMVAAGIPVLKITRPDLTDNLFKGLIDALTGIVWHDDAQIAGVERSYKVYSVDPRIELEVRIET